MRSFFYFVFCKESVFAKMGKLEGYAANLNNCDRGIVWAFDIAQALFFWVFSSHKMPS